MAEQAIIRRTSLKDRLDAIEKKAREKVVGGYYKSRLVWLVSLFDMGEAIDLDVKSRGVKVTFVRLEEETGRARQSLKKWHNLFLKYKTKDRYLPDAEAKAQQWTLKALGDGQPHVAQNSGVSEWYTPQEYIEAARKVMGSIDLDPATTKEVNQRIKAKAFYTKENSGLGKAWFGNVWLNPPYAQPLVSEFCHAVVGKYAGSEIQQACVLINNTTETGFGQELLSGCSAVCFPKGRIAFLDIEGVPGAPLQGQMLLYYGENARGFVDEFSVFGVCLCVAR